MTAGTKRFKAHMGKCELECPAGFTPKLVNEQEVGVCIKCKAQGELPATGPGLFIHADTSSLLYVTRGVTQHWGH